MYSEQPVVFDCPGVPKASVLVFWGGAAVAGHPGEQRYTEATALYPGARPTVYQKGKPVEGPMTITWQLPTGDLRHWDPQT